MTPTTEQAIAGLEDVERFFEHINSSVGDQAISAAIAELLRLAKVEEALPKTRDGVPIVPGMKVYRPSVPIVEEHEVIHLSRYRLYFERRGIPYSFTADLGLGVYSTEAAALAATEGAKQP